VQELYPYQEGDSLRLGFHDKSQFRRLIDSMAAVLRVPQKTWRSSRRYPVLRNQMQSVAGSRQGFTDDRAPLWSILVGSRPSGKEPSYFLFADNPTRIVASSGTRYAGIKEMAAIGEGGHTNRALCVAYIFIGVA
jgi:hypothetical protein